MNDAGALELLAATGVGDTASLLLDAPIVGQCIGTSPSIIGV